jgi:hypothetical protein
VQGRGAYMKSILVALLSVLYIGSSASGSYEINRAEVREYLEGYIYTNQHKTIKKNFTEKNRKKLAVRTADCIMVSSDSEGIPYNILNRLAERESNYRYWAVSNPGQRLERQAFGVTGVKLYYWGQELHEILPASIQRKINHSTNHIVLYKKYAKQIGFNIEWGAKRLKKYYNKFGSWRLALLAYNTGSSSAETRRAKNDTKYLNEHKYVRFVYHGIKVVPH